MYRIHGNVDLASGVYYKLLKSRSGLMTVACLQWFDEFDYDESRFVRDESGQVHVYETEEMAAADLNKWYEQDKIEPEYRDIVRNDPDLIRE